VSERQNGFGGRVDLDRVRMDRTRGMIHGQTRALHRYFEELRAGRACPARAEVDPRDMPCRASNLFILEDIGAGTLRFRLAGSALTETCGQELRGLDPRILMEGRARESFVALIQECLAEPGTGYARLARTGPGDEAWECLLLPLRSDSGAIDRILGILVPLTGEALPASDRPLRFSIPEMSIRAISTAAPQPAAGFAEAGQTPFSGAEAPRQGLTAIEGGRDRDETGRGDRKRGAHLRIVRDD